MSTWFEGSNEIACDIQQVKSTLENLGEYFVGITALMPGLTSAELIEQGNDFVTIRTSEGLMKRTSISNRVEAQSVVVEFDEEYQAGKIVAKTHFLQEFTASEVGVKHRTVMSDVQASGLLGFFYRNFAKSSIGNAVLKSTKAYFEKQTL